MSPRDDDSLLELVGRLSPVRDEQLQGAVDENAKRSFAREIVTRHAQETHAPGDVAASPSRTWWHGRRLVVAGAATVVLVAAALVAWPGAAPPVVAAWDPVPEQLSEQQREMFDASCRDDFDEGYELVVADKRGPMVQGLYATDDGQIGHCERFELFGHDDGTWTAGGMSVSAPLEPVTDGPILVAEEAGASMSDNRVATWRVHGRVTDQVAAVVGVLDDGATFHASLEQGYFHGWWPEECTSRWLPNWLQPENPHNPFEGCTGGLQQVVAYDADGDEIDRWHYTPNGHEPTLRPTDPQPS